MDENFFRKFPSLWLIRHDETFSPGLIVKCHYKGCPGRAGRLDQSYDVASRPSDLAASIYGLGGLRRGACALGAWRLFSLARGTARFFKRPCVPAGLTGTTCAPPGPASPGMSGTLAATLMAANARDALMRPTARPTQLPVRQLPLEQPMAALTRPQGTTVRTGQHSSPG